VAIPQKAQQKEWRRSPAHILRWKVQEYYEEDIPDRAYLLELGWYTKEVVVSYVECEGCGQKGCHVEENRGQGVILDRQKWCGCQKRKETETACPTKGKAQQGRAQAEGTAREVRRMFKILREVWMDIGIEKVDIHKGVMVKVLLDSGTMGMFMDQKMAAKYGFRLQKLERPIMVRNVDGTNNSAGAITHQVEANVYYKSHVERMRMDVCDLGKTDIILGILWLQAHNPEIN